LATLVDGHAEVNVNPFELGYLGELARYDESTNSDSNTTCGEFDAQVN
jgi:hypothetical protein